MYASVPPIVENRFRLELLLLNDVVRAKVNSLSLKIIELFNSENSSYLSRSTIQARPKSPIFTVIFYSDWGNFGCLISIKIFAGLRSLCIILQLWI